MQRTFVVFMAVVLLASAPTALAQTPTAQDSTGSAEVRVATAQSHSATLTAGERREALAIFATGFGLWQSGDMGAAEQAFRQGLAIDPANAPANFYLGDILSRGGIHDEARSYFELASGLGGSSPQVFQARAALQADIVSRRSIYCSNNANSFSSRLVIAGCSAVIESGQGSNTDRSEAFHARALANQSEGNITNAVADFTEAIRLDPTFPSIPVNRGNLYSREGDYVRALADYNEALRVDPRHTNAYFNRGNTYYLMGDIAQAIMDYGRALRLDPRDAYALNGRCWVYATQGQELDRALADCNASLRIASLPGTLDSRGLVHMRRGEFSAALADYDAALRGDASLVGSLYGRGVARLRLGQTAEGQADIAAALARDPNVAAEFAGWGVSP